MTGGAPRMRWSPSELSLVPTAMVGPSPLSGHALSRGSGEQPVMVAAGKMTWPLRPRDQHYRQARAPAQARPGHAAQRARPALREPVAQYAVLTALEEEPGLSNADLARRAFVTPQTMN